MPGDVLDAWRKSALAGLSAPSEPVSWRKPMRARAVAGAPPLPPNTPALSREPIVTLLHEEALRCWRRAVPAWTPALDVVVARGPVAVEVSPGLVTVQLPLATYRARGVPTPWVPVVVALLLGEELVPVRKALRRGVRRFEPGVRP